MENPPLDAGKPVSSSNGQYHEVILQAIDNRDTDLQQINRVIFNNPELGFEEFQAHDNLVTLLRSLGFEVTPHAYGVETSFFTEYGSGGRVVIFNAEYDALPGIGHASSFLGVVAALKASGAPGRVRLLGTPAEEGGGGKQILVDAGAFKDVDACFMSHPAPCQMVSDATLTGEAYGTTLAMAKFTASFSGKPAHAGAAPYQGVNALDALTLAYNAVSMLRQQTKDHDRIHFIVEKGGDAPNVIPSKASSVNQVRSATMKELRELKARVKKCFEGSAIATGCMVEFQDILEYADLRPNKVLCGAYASEMAQLGWPVECDLTKTTPGSGSTDQGNVSYACPSFHSMFSIDSQPGAFNHTAGFTVAAGTESAYRKSIASAKGMALAAWKVLVDDQFAKRVQEDFEADAGIRKAAAV
ncbi:hypothetical protein BDV12DRAFT_206989 [Aspergillus spectabilis]